MMGIVSEVENETGTPLVFPTEESAEPVGWSLFDKKHQARHLSHRISYDVLHFLNPGTDGGV